VDQPGIGGHTLPVHDTPYELREGAHFDPDGNLIRLGSPSPAQSLPDRIGAHLERTYQVRVTRLLPLVLDGYRSRLDLIDEEVERLGNAALARPVVAAVWRFCMGRATLRDALEQVVSARRTVDAIEARVRGLAR
jgi:hypothetical protein